MKLVFDNTTSQDEIGREAIVDLCVCCIRELNALGTFEVLLSECDGLGAAIIAHERLSLMLEGTFMCGHGELEHRGAVPCCSSCGHEYTMLYIRAHRHESFWECPACNNKSMPVCTEHEDTFAGLTCGWVAAED